MSISSNSPVHNHVPSLIQNGQNGRMTDPNQLLVNSSHGSDNHHLYLVGADGYRMTWIHIHLATAVPWPPTQTPRWNTWGPLRCKCRSNPEPRSKTANIPKAPTSEQCTLSDPWNQDRLWMTGWYPLRISWIIQVAHIPWVVELFDGHSELQYNLSRPHGIFKHVRWSNNPALSSKWIKLIWYVHSLLVKITLNL